MVKNSGKIDKLIWTISVVLIAICMFLPLNNYFERYSTPPASDPYFFCAQANHINQYGEIMNYSPADPKEDNNYAPLFSILLSSISKITGADTIEILYFLPVFIIAGIFSSIFILIRSNKHGIFEYILSLLFLLGSFVAFRNLTIGIPQSFYLVILVLSMWLSTNNKPKYILLNCIILSGLLLSHYITGLFGIGYFILIHIIKIIQKENTIKNFKNKLVYAGFIPLLMSIAVTIVHSKFLGIFNPNYASGIGLQNFIFSLNQLEIYFASYSILIALVMALIAIFNKKNIAINIILILLLTTFFWSYIPVLEIFSPFVKRAMIFIALIGSITVGLNYQIIISKLQPSTKPFAVFFVIVILISSFASYQERSWISYFDKTEIEAASELNKNQKYIAIYPYNLLLQCYPANRIGDIDVITTDFLIGNNQKFEKINNSTLFYSENTFETLRKSGLGINKDNINNILVEFPDIIQENRDIQLRR